MIAKELFIYLFPKDEGLFQKWIVQMKQNIDPTFSYKSTSCVYGLHFCSDRKLGGNNIPTGFNQNENIIYGIDADCDTECIGLKSALNPELNSQSSSESMEISNRFE